MRAEASDFGKQNLQFMILKKQMNKQITTTTTKTHTLARKVIGKGLNEPVCVDQTKATELVVEELWREERYLTGGFSSEKRLGPCRLPWGRGGPDNRNPRLLGR